MPCSSSDGSALDESVLAEQRRQADLAAEVTAVAGLADVEMRDVTLDGPIAARSLAIG